MSNDNLITARQAANILGCSHRWIRYLLKAKKIEGVRLSGQWAISRASVEEYKAEKEQGKNGGKDNEEKQDDTRTD